MSPEAWIVIIVTIIGGMLAFYTRSNDGRICPTAGTFSLISAVDQTTI
jgi:hypothetical protein